MGMKASSNHFKGGAGGESKRNGNFSLNMQLFAKMPKGRAQVMHIMAKRKGHLPNSKANQKLLIKISRDNKNYIGKDENGNTIYSKIIKGNEYWVHVRRGIIQNGGSNGRNYRHHDFEGRKKR